MSTSKPTILVLGSTGQIGKLVVEHLGTNSDVQLRLCSRRQEAVDALHKQGKQAVRLDLDDPSTFALALSGTFVDAAVKAGVKHIVHLGIFGEWDTTDPHFNLLGATSPTSKELKLYWGTAAVGWVAVSDIAAMAAAVLHQGPDKHASRDYWMSVDVLDGSQVASILSETTGHPIAFKPQTHKDFETMISAPGSGAEPWYAKGGADFMRQVANHQMGYIGSIRDDIPYVLGRPALTFREWAIENKDKFVEILSKE